MLDRFYKVRRQRAEQIAALQRVFKTEDGQRALQWMMNTTHVMDSSMTDDTHTTAFNEGARSIGLQLMNAIDMPYDKIMDLIKNNDSEVE